MRRRDARDQLYSDGVLGSWKRASTESCVDLRKIWTSRTRRASVERVVEEQILRLTVLKTVDEEVKTVFFSTKMV